MRVTKWVDGRLGIEGNIDAGIQDAFDKKRYVEAFVHLHGWLDLLMQIVFQNYEVSKGRIGRDLISLIDENPSWQISLDRLSDSKIISKEEKQRLIAFNRLRNRVIHRLIVRSYHPSRWDKLTPVEVETVFEEGKKSSSNSLDITFSSDKLSYSHRSND